MLRPFGWQAVVAAWQFAPVVTGAVVLAAGLYLWGVRRVARRHPARPWPAWRTCMFLGGLAVVVLATESGIGSYDDVLFWDHMVQHLMLIMVARRCSSSASRSRCCCTRAGTRCTPGSSGSRGRGWPAS